VVPAGWRRLRALPPDTGLGVVACKSAPREILLGLPGLLYLHFYRRGRPRGAAPGVPLGCAIVDSF